MKICFFGIYNPDYARNKVLRTGFERLGHEVVDCRVSPGKSNYWNLFKKGWKFRDSDLIIVAFPGQSIVWLAYLVFGRRIVFDAFLSLYNSNVEDRRLYGRWSIWALKDWLLDWYSTHLASIVLLDTNEHIKYFQKKFFLNPKKCIRVLVGSDFKKGSGNKDKFIVHFHGNFIPLQGVPYIVKAISYLSDLDNLKVVLVGEKVAEYARSLSLEDKFELPGQVSKNELQDLLQDSSVVLGIFGDTIKTDLVIPNKVYEAAAVGKAIISAETRAIKEVFEDRKDILLCKKANPESLAEKIRMLYNDKDLRERIAVGAGEVFNEKCRPETVVKELLRKINEK